jgi:hypothetical protein
MTRFDNSGRPHVAAGNGSDPVTGFGGKPVRIGSGPVSTDPARVRVAYIDQSWDGIHRYHDSWQSGSARSEVLPLGAVRTQFLADVRRGVQRGYAIMLLLPAGTLAGSGSHIVVVEVTAV